MYNTLYYYRSCDILDSAKGVYSPDHDGSNLQSESKSLAQPTGRSRFPQTLIIKLIMRSYYGIQVDNFCNCQ